MDAALRDYNSALITGASSGIGAAFAKILPTSTRLLLAGRNEQRLREVVNEVASAGGGVERITCLSADLATAEGCGALIERAQAAEIDLLVCNAGLGSSGKFLESPMAAARATLSVNIVAVTELLHALLPGMIARARTGKRRAGVIIVSSTAAFALAPAGIACYAASKAFVQRLAETLAAECQAEPLDVLALCPTYTRTAFFAQAGLPAPPDAMEPGDVAREAMAALGRHSVHLCGIDRLSQGNRQLEAYNPALSTAGRIQRRLARLLLKRNLPR